MSDFITALQEKIDELEEAREAAVQEFDTKLELLRELMESEGEAPTSKVKVPAKRRAGRPKGSKNKKPDKNESKHAPADELYDEAMAQLSRSEEGGTTPELQEKLTKRFNPTPRTPRKLGTGVTAGTKKQVDATRSGHKADATVSVDESDLEDE